MVCCYSLLIRFFVNTLDHTAGFWEKEFTLRGLETLRDFSSANFINSTLYQFTKW